MEVSKMSFKKGTVWMIDRLWLGSVYPTDNGYLAIVRASILSKKEKTFGNKEEAENYVENELRGELA